jgi:hypothetical protein
MEENTFIGIVPSQGSKDSKWNGVFKFDEIEGYTGKLLSNSIEARPGQDIFTIPEELDKKALYCLIDGNQFGTIIWPELRGVQIKNFVAQIRDLRIRTLIRGVHIGEAENDVKKITLQSPILAQLFRLRAFVEKIETSPYKLSIESADTKDIEFLTNVGKISIGVSGTYSPADRTPAPSIKASHQDLD